MIGFYVNLLPPATPLQFNLQTPCGTREFRQVPNFGQAHQEVLQGATANTYTMTFPLPVRSGQCDADGISVGDRLFADGR
jgi:hypothetical protein